ncbi:MAG: type IV pilin protein [Methylococcales bacterium]|nr:type IV pilin protein [Methylococcales bacterium]
MKQKQAGFTLIELMIAVAIIGIVASIAYPSYQDSVRKSRRSDAKAGLLSLQMAQAKFRASCPRYAGAIGTNSACSTTGTFTVKHGGDSPDGHYTLSIVAADANSYTLRATRKAGGAQASDRCGDFQVNQDGVKSLLNNSGGQTVATCW